jgi:hypothetical protein
MAEQLVGAVDQMYVQWRSLAQPYKSYSGPIKRGDRMASKALETCAIEHDLPP